MSAEDIARRILPLLDLTSLNDGDTEQVIASLCAKALTPVGPVAAICIYPRFIAAASPLLDQRISLATVVNFPAGESDRQTVTHEIRSAVAAGADEIDLVFPYSAFLSGKKTYAREIVSAAREAADKGILLKVILETGRLESAGAIREAAEAAIGSGADFLKTSTGKVQPAATLEAARIMLQVIHDLDDEVGFKAAGGIRTVEEAGAYLALADEILGPDWATQDTFRIGASSLLDDLLARLGHAPKMTSTGAY